MTENKIYKKLFFTFFKIGLFTFGGGYAMIPLIHKEAVETHQWIDDKEILDILAIAESTPGPMAINSATFVGYKVGGAWGSFFATLGVVIPSFFIILFISLFYQSFRENEWVNYAFMGIRAGVAVLLINATIRLSKALHANIFNIVLIVLAFIATVFFDISVIMIIFAAAIVGVIARILRTRKQRGQIE